MHPLTKMLRRRRMIRIVADCLIDFLVLAIVVGMVALAIFAMADFSQLY